MIIEQAYMCMTELFHFIEQGSLLKALSTSDFVRGSLDLILNWQSYPFLSMKIFKKIAAFLRELSNDNPYCKGLHSEALDNLVVNLVNTVFIDNADFAANLLSFHFNVTLNHRGVDSVASSSQYLNLVNTLCEKLFAIESGLSP